MQLLDDGAKKGKVMKELLMMKGAKVLVDVATKVQAGETVLWSLTMLKQTSLKLLLPLPVTEVQK